MKLKNIKELTRDYEELITRHNEVGTSVNGIYCRYKNPVLTAEHAPLIWRYDMSENDNPLCEERIGINAVMNSGAIKLDGKYYLMARVEGADRKSFLPLQRVIVPQKVSAFGIILF